LHTGMNETQLRFSEPLLREAVRAFVFRAVIRQLGISFFIVVAVLIAFVAFLISRHDRGWMVGFLIATVLFVGVSLAFVYVAHFRNTIGRFRQMRTPEATFGYDEQQVTFTSELGSATMPWSAITEVWRYPRFWLLLFSRSQFVTLPLDCLDEQAQAFITRKTTEPNA
jgi:hypothetical protein